MELDLLSQSPIDALSQLNNLVLFTSCAKMVGFLVTRRWTGED